MLEETQLECGEMCKGKLPSPSRLASCLASFCTGETDDVISLFKVLEQAEQRAG